MANPHRVAVIGAGYAGMAAAVELARSGSQVTVYEAAKQFGGRARATHYREQVLDNGQHILAGAYHETLRLMELVGIAPTKVLLRQPFEFDLPGKLHIKAAPLPAPFHLAWGLLTASGLTWQERLSAMRFTHTLRRQQFKLTHDTSVQALLLHHQQNPHVIRCFWEPLCVAAMNTPLDQASAQVFLHVLRDSLHGRASDSDLLLPKTDLSSLFPEPAAQFIQQHQARLRLSTPVRRLDKNTNGITLSTDTDAECFSHVVCAVSPQRIGGMISNLPELSGIAALIAKFRYQPICTVYLQYPPQTTLPKSMLGATGSFIQWAFDRGKLHGNAGLIAVVISAEGKHQNLPHATLAQEIHRELALYCSNLPTPLWHKVIMEKRATFSCHAGLSRPTQSTPLPGFYLAGDYTAGDYPATLEGAVRSGVKCAQLILETT